MDHFYKTIEGQFNYEDVYNRAVQEMSIDKGSVFIEIGAWLGRSSSYMCVEILNSKKNIKFYIIDNWSGSPDDVGENGSSSLIDYMKIKNFNSEQVYDTFKKNMRPLNNYIDLKMSSIEAANMFKDNSVDFLFLDGDHRYNEVKKDIIAWLPKIKIGGIFSGHDFHYPSVNRAVLELLYQVKPISQNSYWYVKRA
jgi:precorrin-6B methylase 2